MIKIQALVSKKELGWYWRIKARNGKILCHSEIYTTRQMCYKAINSMLKSIMESDFLVEEVEHE